MASARGQQAGMLKLRMRGVAELLELAGNHEGDLLTDDHGVVPTRSICRDATYLHAVCQ